MGRNRTKRTVAAVLVAGGLLLTGAGACDDGGPGVPGQGESGTGDETGGDSGAGEDGAGEPGEGGAGDEIGGGG